MRALLPTATVCLLLSPLWSDSAAPQSPAAAPAAAASAAPATAAENDAAARHAKRTACVKKARAKKLLGDEKTTFIKECTSAP